MMAIGALAFIVSMVVQVIKEMPVLVKLPTNVVALVTAMIICPVAVIIACQYFKIVTTWYYIFASFIAAFIVYLVATGGWDRVHEMWNRTKYDKKLRKMNETDKLIERIDKEIEKKMMATGAMGSETVSVFVDLTDEEKELFYDIDKYDGKHYSWDFDGNELCISYTEDV